ncbi:hypothetical protein ACFQ1R_11565 [Mariniflexile jejuense]|uniref:Lipocalin-like protein n=1 Tax=Mariniflexile jejuense TaxID=1173582 RepID=A0ABW3JN63_9FLAO
MKIIPTLLIAISLILSCQQNPDELIKGVWHYVDKKPPKPTLTKMTEISESGEEKIIDLEKEYPTMNELHFFLTFKNNSLTQNKFGLKLTTEFNIKDNIIYLDKKPFFKIIKLTEKELIVQRIDSGNQTKYDKVESDSPLLKLAE